MKPSQCDKENDNYASTNEKSSDDPAGRQEALESIGKSAEKAGLPPQTLIWNDLVKYLFCFFFFLIFFFFPSFRRRQRKSRSRRLLRRLITLIFAGRNRIIVIRRELPRTRCAGSVLRPTA